MTQSVVTIDGLTKLANDLLVQNTAIRNRLDAAEKQRDELLEALELADALLSGANMNKNVVEKKVKTTIAKAKGE